VREAVRGFVVCTEEVLPVKDKRVMCVRKQGVFNGFSRYAIAYGQRIRILEEVAVKLKY